MRTSVVEYFCVNVTHLLAITAPLVPRTFNGEQEQQWCLSANIESTIIRHSSRASRPPQTRRKVCYRVKSWRFLTATVAVFSLGIISDGFTAKDNTLINAS